MRWFLVFFFAGLTLEAAGIYALAGWPMTAILIGIALIFVAIILAPLVKSSMI